MISWCCEGSGFGDNSEIDTFPTRNDARFVKTAGNALAAAPIRESEPSEPDALVAGKYDRKQLYFMRLIS
jgi:hypothetical protein